MEFQLLIQLNLIVKFVLYLLLVLLHIRVLIELDLHLTVSIFPLFNFSKPTLQNAIDSVVLQFHVAELSLITVDFMLKVLELLQLKLFIRELLLPMLNL